MTVRQGGASLAVTRHLPDRSTDSTGSSQPPIVALHPGVGDQRFWQGCVPAWTAAGHAVVTYDRRGFGATVAPAEPHDHVEDLLAVLDATCDGPAVLVGNSMGGQVALQCALDHPDRVAVLVLVAAAVSGFPDEDWPLDEAEQAQDELIAAADEAGDLEAVNRLEARYWLDGTSQPEGRVGGAARTLFLDANGIALRHGDVGPAEGHPPQWPRLPEVRVPTVVVEGAHDLPGFAVMGERLAEAIPRARLVVLPDSAHCPSLDQPDALAALVLAAVTDPPR